MVVQIAVLKTKPDTHHMWAHQIHVEKIEISLVRFYTNIKSFVLFSVFYSQPKIENLGCYMVELSQTGPKFHHTLVSYFLFIMC